MIRTEIYEITAMDSHGALARKECESWADYEDIMSEFRSEGYTNFRTVLTTTLRLGTRLQYQWSGYVLPESTEEGPRPSRTRWRGKFTWTPARRSH